jgi:folate-dependent phosphoribosylglycinamide formyltransferase PurN
MHDWFRAHASPVEIAFVAVSDPEAPIVGLCGELGLRVEHLPVKDMRAYEARLLELCGREGIGLIALAGFLKLLSAEFIQMVGIPILNVHPALLPNYGGKGMYGLRVHQAVFANGDWVSGASVNLVDPVYDHGRVIAQETVDIGHCRSPEEIAAEVLKAEHHIYAPAIMAVLRGELP